MIDQSYPFPTVGEMNLITHDTYVVSACLPIDWSDDYKISYVSKQQKLPTWWQGSWKIIKRVPCPHHERQEILRLEVKQWL
jgi:hypothetical protein